MWRRSVSSRSPSARAEQPGRAGRSRAVIASSSDATPAAAEQVGPLVEADVDVLPRRLVGRRDPLGRPAEEHRERGGADAGGDDGRSSASSSASHSRATGVPNTLPAPLITAGTPTGVERVAHQRAVTVGADEHGDVPGPHRLGGGSDAVEVAGDRPRRPTTAARRRRRRGRRRCAAAPEALLAQPVRGEPTPPSSRWTTRTRSAARVRRAAQPGLAGARRRPARCGTRCPRGRAWRRRTARRRRRRAPGRCAS